MRSACLASILLLACSSSRPSPPVQPSAPADADADTDTDTDSDPDAERALVWIEKLDDADQLDRALNELERLRHPSAIGPLRELWRREPSPRIVHVLLGIAESEEHRGPHWKRALPALIEIAEAARPADRRGNDSATLAIDGIRRSGLVDAVPSLVAIVRTPSPSLSAYFQRVRIAAIRAIATLDAEGSLDLLLELAAASEDAEPLHVVAAAIDGLARPGDPRALDVVVETAFRRPAIHHFCRRVLASIGAEHAVPYLREVLARKNARVESIFEASCKKRDDTNACLRLATVEYKAALLLGDLRDPNTVGDLAAQLATKPRPAFASPDGRRVPTQHHGAIEALRLIGTRVAAKPLLATWKRSALAPEIRGAAIHAYSQLASPPTPPRDLAAAATSTNTDFRRLGLTAYARLANKPAHAKQIVAWSKKAEARDRGFYELLLAQVVVGIECRGDVACLARMLAPDADVAGLAAAYMPVRAEALALRIAGRERALLDLAKRGPTAREQLGAVLDAAGSKVPSVREAALHAITRVAPPNCPRCIEHLDAVIERDSADTSRTGLVVETKVVRNWLRGPTRRFQPESRPR